MKAFIHTQRIKLTAIYQVPKLTDVAGVRCMLAMVTYLAKFLPQLATMLEPLIETADDKQDCMGLDG